MPDLINPTFNEGKKETIIWIDELCISCKRSEDCPLIQLITEHRIMTHGGIHVSNCGLYDPDADSPYYVSPEQIGLPEQVKLDFLNQQIAEIEALLEQVNEHVA